MITIKEAQTSKELMNEFIKENMGLVNATINKMNLPLTEDYIQEGAIGLLKAAKKFDSSRGIAFSTYAVPLIRGEILKYQRDYESASAVGGIKMSRHLKEIYYKSLRYEGYKDIDICKILGISHKQLQEVRSLMNLTKSLDKNIHSDDSEDKPTDLHTLVPSNICVEEETIDKLFITEMLEYAAEEYGQKAAEILKKYLSGLTQAQISQKVGLSQVQVSRMINKIIRSFKKMAV